MSIIGAVRNMAWFGAGTAVRDDRDTKGTYRSGSLYRNLRNVGLVYKYFGNTGIREHEVRRLLEFLASASGTDPLTFETVVCGDRSSKTYHVAFWYGPTLSRNTHTLSDPRQTKRWYRTLLSLRPDVESLPLMKGAVEPDPSFSPFPKRSDSKSALETVNDENLSIAGEASALEARKAAIVKENMVRIMEKSWIGQSNYRMEPGRILFEMKGDIGSSVVDERHYEKLETFGAYMGDDDFMMPLWMVVKPFESGGEYVVDFDVNDLYKILDRHVARDTIHRYVVSTTMRNAKGVSVGSWDRYRVQGDAVRKFKGVSENGNLLAECTMTVTIFAKDNDVRPLLDDLETELRSVSFRMMDGKILSNEVFMNHNDSFNASKLYGLPSNVAFLFDPMKRFMKPMETGVRFGVDFFSGNEFKVSILDMVSKNKEDLSLEGAPHAVITGSTGSGKTFLMKKYYEEVRHEQLVAIDNKGNFQTIAPSKRGHVLKYGRDLASIIGTVTSKAVARERFLVLKEWAEEYAAQVSEALSSRGRDFGEIAHYFAAYVAAWTNTRSEKLFFASLPDFLVPYFHSSAKEAADELSKSAHYKRLNERNENVYDRKIGEAAVVATEKSIAEAIVGFMESNVGKPFSISDFREYLGAVTNDRLVTYAVSLEHDFPNLIGTVNEANRTAKEGVFTDILVWGAELSEEHRTLISGAVSSYFKRTDYFRFDEFAKYARGPEIKEKIKDVLEALVDSVDSRTVSILNRPVSLLEETLASGRHQKIIISNEYVMNEVASRAKRVALAIAIFRTVYSYINLVKEWKANNRFAYTTVLIDEAHNYMDYEELKAYMEKLSLELRNNRGNLLFISQYLSHFTKNILAGAPFRILLSREELEYYVANVATDEDELFRLKSLTPGIKRWEKEKLEYRQAEDAGKAERSESYRKFFCVFVDNRKMPYFLAPKFS